MKQYHESRYYDAQQVAAQFYSSNRRRKGSISTRLPGSCNRHLSDIAMMASTTTFPGRSPFGRSWVENAPCRAHPSIRNVPHNIVHIIVHDQPIHPPTRNPVTLLKPSSMPAPTPM